MQCKRTTMMYHAQLRIWGVDPPPAPGQLLLGGRVDPPPEPSELLLLRGGDPPEAPAAAAVGG